MVECEQTVRLEYRSVAPDGLQKSRFYCCCLLNIYLFNYKVINVKYKYKTFVLCIV